MVFQIGDIVKTGSKGTYTRRFGVIDGYRPNRTKRTWEYTIYGTQKWYMPEQLVRVTDLSAIAAAVEKLEETSE